MSLSPSLLSTRTLTLNRRLSLGVRFVSVYGLIVALLLPSMAAGRTLIADINRGGSAAHSSTTGAPVPSAPETETQLATVQNAPRIEGLVDGTVQVLDGEHVDVDSDANITEDLLVPGTPKVKTFGSPHYKGTVDSNGNAQPSDYTVAINNGAQLRHVVRRTDPVTISPVPEPPDPTGKKNVKIEHAGQSVGDFSKLHNLTLEDGVGQVVVPPGTYGEFTANKNSGFTFGVAGSAQPSVYNLQHLSLDDQTQLNLNGPVILTVDERVVIGCGATVGSSSDSTMLSLGISKHGIVIGKGSQVFADVRAPQGRAEVSGTLTGTVVSNHLFVNGGALKKGGGHRVNHAPVVNAGPAQTIQLPGTALLTGSVTDDGLPQGSTLTISWSVVSGPGSVTFSAPNSATTNAAFSAPGVYVLALSASDGQLSSTSNVTITVLAANQPPVVNAGPAQTIELPATASLHGSVTDDGFPVGGTLTVSWSKVSGPGNVSFNPPNAASTTASFSAAGTYVLQLAANDGQLSSSSNVTVTVLPVNQAPVVNAGPAQTIELPANAVLNGTITDDGFPVGSTLSASWSTVSGPGQVTFSPPNAASTTASFSVAGTYVLRLTGSDGQLSSSSNVTVTVLPVNQAPVVNAGQAQTIELPATAALNGSVTDDGFPQGGTLSVSWSKVSGPGNVTFNPANAAVSTASFSAAGSYVLRLTASDGQLSASSDVTITVLPANQAPVVNAGPAQTIELPASAVLNGTATDDGFPVGSTLTVSWSQVSGPGTTTFSPQNSASTTASFSVAGTYVLRLTGSDGQLSSTSDVTITVLPVNQAPVVNAGPAQTIELPANATLNGTATDDGFPQGSTLSVSWSKISGPGTVTFTPANAAATTAAFSVAGSYLLRLTASDGQLSSTSDVTVTVLPVNQAPVVNAGNAQTIELPATAALNGSATDDGFPQGSTLSVSWSKVSGPGTVTFNPANAAVSTASFSAAGTYVLRLTGSDGQLSSTSDVTVTVLPVNQAPVVNAGQAQSIELPANATLNGTATDDGFPQGSTLTVSWSQVSGPGTTTFNPASTAVTTASFSTAGTYVLRLTGSDGQLSSTSDVTVTVFPVNQAPVVNAGTDQLIPSPGMSANLNGTVSDDGLPLNSTLSSTWSVVVGPGTVTFGDATQPVTTATFSATGTYVLRLTATDGQLSASDDVKIKVHSPCIDIPSGLAGWWAGEGNAADSTFNANDGTPVSGVQFASAIDGRGFLFNGTNYVQIPDNATLKPANVTVDTWVRFDALDSPGASGPGLEYLVFKKNSRADRFEGYALLKNRVNGQDKFQFFVSSAAGAQIVATSVTSVVQGQFYHVAGSYDGANVKIYVNGVLEAQTAAGFAMDYGTRPVFLGTTGESFDGKLTGALDEVHIFNRALADAEVQSIFHALSFGICNALSVSAGPDQTISQPASSVNLNGSASEPSDPTATITTNWTTFSGPAAATFGDPTSPVTTASFSVAGTYVLQLVASDGSVRDSGTLTVTVLPPCTNLPSGLAAWWRGEGDASDFLNRNNGTLVNNPSFTSAVVGQGFHFNGTNSVQVPDSADLKPARVTVDAWVKFDSLDSPGASMAGLQYLVFKKNTRSSAFEAYTLLKLRVNGQDKIQFYVTSAGGAQVFASSVTNIVAGQFYHVAGTYDGTIARLYINGVQESQATGGFPLDYSATPLFLGTSGQSFDGKLVGVLDEVHLFNRALTAAEIQTLTTTGTCH